MTTFFKTLTFNQRLAVLAFVLGALALAARPDRGATITVNARELAVSAARGGDQVAPSTLAGWIIEGRSDFRLLDLRSDADFGRYHIPGAQNVPAAALFDEPISPTEKILLCSEDGVRAAQAWVLLRGRGVHAVYVLSGGMRGWNDEVLFPVLAVNATGAEALRNDTLRAVSTHFGGTPRNAAGQATAAIAPMAPPAIQAPVVESVPPAASAKKPKKKEGC